jgi:hypothetical protein
VKFLLSKSFETYTQKQLEDTKGVLIRSHNSKNRQYNEPKKNIKERTSLISNFATFSVLELCPLIYLIGKGSFKDNSTQVSLFKFVISEQM